MKIKASKANTLFSLKEKLALFEVPNLFIFKVSEYEENELSIISKIQADFSGKKVACRSSWRPCTGWAGREEHAT